MSRSQRNDESPSSPHSGDEENVPAVDNDVDQDTLRIMVSTDNHLGYAERDPIRGNDSFAAFEEVLVLAKKHNCDMVLLAGDLFHENKPTRRTLHKTMGILRKYCMGNNPVSFQIASNQAENFRSSVNGTANHEDPFSSVDLPIFSIHGNHDDPTRDGGTEMLAALDLLAVSSLVNYFGRQDEVDKVQVAPVLIKKGNTKVSLYGMGSMRDERLNRMWQGKKVRFSQPDAEEDESEEEDGDDDGGWFNIFALHQNRDLGRGTKNCVHESMIPEWMDLVVWGHEHECRIDPQESAVGTFRITQPGSSVATSLTEGEALPKHVGILDIRESQFRLRAVQLKQVRAFATGSITLRDCDLDIENPNIEENMAECLADEVTRLVDDARKQMAANCNGIERNGENRQFRVEKPQQVLVRLRVEHSGFSTLHNQRFGSRFVKEVANPSDILLFHRKRATDTSKSGKKKKASKGLEEPVLPNELDEVDIETIVKDTLDTGDKKLQILDDQRLGVAVDNFVSKEQKTVFGETVDKIVVGQQSRLVTRGQRKKADNQNNVAKDENKVTTANAVREVCQQESQRVQDDDEMDVDETNGTSSQSQTTRKRSRYNAGHKSDSEEESILSSARKKPKNGGGRREQVKKTKKRVMNIDSDDDNDDDDEIEVVNTRRKNTQSQRSQPLRKTSRARSQSQYLYKDDDDDEFEEGDNDDDEFEEEEEENPSYNRRTGKNMRRTRNDSSQVSRGTSSSFTASKKTRTGRRNVKAKSYVEEIVDDDDDDDDDIEIVAGSTTGGGWGTAASSEQELPLPRTRRGRRR